MAGGQLCRYRGGIHRKRLRWVCRGGGLVREEALPVSGGSALLLRDARGFLYCRVLYRENQWERSSYFRPGDSRPAVILEPVAGENRILRTDLCPETGKYRRQELLFYHDTPKSALELAEENDMMRFIEHGHTVHAIQSPYKTVSVDTPKDLTLVARILTERGATVEE